MGADKAMTGFILALRSAECLWPPFRAGKGPGRAGPWEIAFWAHIGAFVAGVVLIGWLDEECKIAVGKALSTDAKKTRELFIFF